MKPIQWPKNAKAKSPSAANRGQIKLPELDIAGSDYEAAGKVLRKPDGRLSHVDYMNEVAARICRERQLREAISRRPEHRDGEDLIKSWKMPVSIDRFGSDPSENA
jgi:hypothetical protein